MNWYGKVGLRKPQPRRTYGGYDYFNAPSRMTLPIREGVGCKPEPVLTPEQAEQYRRYYS